MQVKTKGNHSLKKKLCLKAWPLKDNQRNSQLLFQTKYKLHILVKKISTLRIKSTDIQSHKLETLNLLKTITFIEKMQVKARGNHSCKKNYV